MNPHLADALAYVTELEADPTPPTSAMHVWLMELARERAELLLTLAAEQGKAAVPYADPARMLATVNAARIERRMSWRDLAHDLGIASSGLTRWSQGRMLSLPAYLKVCTWLDAAMRAADRSTP